MSIDYSSYEFGFADGKDYVLLKIDSLLNKWRKESKYREDIASEDWISNTLNECIEDLKNIVESVGEKND